MKSLQKLVMLLLSCRGGVVPSTLELHALDAAAFFCFSSVQVSAYFGIIRQDSGEHIFSLLWKAFWIEIASWSLLWMQSGLRFRGGESRNIQKNNDVTLLHRCTNICFVYSARLMYLSRVLRQLGYNLHPPPSPFSKRGVPIWARHRLVDDDFLFAPIRSLAALYLLRTDYRLLSPYPEHSSGYSGSVQFWSTARMKEIEPNKIHSQRLRT